MLTIRIRSVVWFATGTALALVVTMIVFQAWSASAAPGDDDSTFVPIAGCRLLDTRPAPDRVGLLTTWEETETKTVQAHGTNGECTIPADAVGLSLNVTTVDASAASFVTLWPSGALPKTSSLNPQPGAPPTPNAVTVALSATGSFEVYNNSGTVDIVIDVNGYYTKSSLAEIASRLVSLESTAPLAMSDRDDQTDIGAVENIQSPTVIASVTMTPSANGQITANSVTNVETADQISGAPSPFAETVCSIGTGSAIDTSYTQVFQPDNDTSFESAHDLLSGTRVFDVIAGVPVTITLVCQHDSLFTSTILTDSVLTTLFTKGS